MIRNWFFALCFTAVLVSAGVARAQGVTAGYQTDDAKRERIRQLVMMRLTSALGLNASQSQQLGGIMRKYQQQRADLHGQVRDLTAQLQAASNSGNEAEIQRIIAQITAVRGQLDRIDDQTFADLKPMLTPKQQAQYFLVMEEIHRDIQAIRHGGAPAGNGAAGPGVNAPPANNQPGGVRVGPP